MSVSVCGRREVEGEEVLVVVVVVMMMVLQVQQGATMHHFHLILQPQEILPLTASLTLEAVHNTTGPHSCFTC